MIMQRFAVSLRERDWGTVLLEIVIVVVGIFIGLQVDDWNESRKDRRDEQRFLQQLHADVLLAEQMSERVRARRLQHLQHMISASDVLYGRVERDELTNDECRAIDALDALNIAVADLPSFAELVATGRLDIVRNVELRNALLGYDQAKGSLKELVTVQTLKTPDLSTDFPALLRRESYFNVADNEVRGLITCDTAGMRADPAYLNQFSTGIDIYDAYVRDGLAPWSSQLDHLHQLVDRILGINHELPGSE